MQERRRRIASVFAGLAIVAGIVGGSSYLWAANREYADNQRNWGYGLAFLGFGGAVFLLLVAALVVGWPSRWPPDEHT